MGVPLEALEGEMKKGIEQIGRSSTLNT